MRLTQVRAADLNLLVVFLVLAEARSVSRAAERLGRSQPAVSRGLGRLREMFQDELLVRTPRGYEPTPRGQRVLSELESMLPRLDQLLGDATFVASEASAVFRVAATDYSSNVVCPVLARRILPRAPKLSFEWIATHEGTFEALDRGRLDMMLGAEDEQVPDQFAKETIFSESFACVVWRGSRHAGSRHARARALSLASYLGAQHVTVSVLGGKQTVPERQLAQAGQQRRAALHVPYFATAMRSVVGTELIATVPRRIAEIGARDPELRLLQPPSLFQSFDYLMVWHPRLATDPAHVWLREVIRSIGVELERPVKRAGRSPHSRAPRARPR